MNRRENDLTYIAETNHRNNRRLFGIKQRDRLSHMYIIGKTGTGKSTLLRTMATQDMRVGRGFAFIDPHGDEVEKLAKLIPHERKGDVTYLDVPTSSKTWHFNPLAGIPKEKRALAVAGMVEVFRKLFPDGWGQRVEHLWRNVLFTLLELPGSTLAHIPRLLADRDYRQAITTRLENKVVRAFWDLEYERYSPGFRAVVVAPLQNKIGAFLTDPLLRRILSPRQSSFNLRQIMDNDGGLLINLSKGELGESATLLLGSLLVSHIALAGLARAAMPEQERSDFVVYLDEFQNFTTLHLVTMLSELRKYYVGLVLAHQFLGQLAPEIRDAVLGNVGTLIAFRVGARDADYLSKEFEPIFDRKDLVKLPNYNIYLKLLIDGEPSEAFSAETTGSVPNLVEIENGVTSK